MITERIEKLRLAALEHNIPWLRSEEGNLQWYRGWMESCNDSNIIRRAKAQAYMLGNSTPVIGDGELIVGKPDFKRLKDSEKAELDMYNSTVARAMTVAGGMASHMAIDHELLLKQGLSGIKEMIGRYRSGLKTELPGDMEKDEFYKACLIALDGVMAYSGRYADHAQALADEYAGSPRHDELIEIARVCRKVPCRPAESFREALQSVHFVNVCLEGLYQLGRPDRYLIDYYMNDVDKNVIGKDSAQELIDCICIIMNEYVPKGAAVGLMVGGSDKEGRDVTNELTYMFIESIGHTRLIYPGIGLCYTPDTPEDLLEMSCGLLAQGLSHPALFNDEIIIKGLMEYGLPYSEACMYIHSTCVEITPIASSGVWVTSPYLNLIKPLLDLMADESGTCCSIEEIKSEYRKRLAQDIKNSVAVFNLSQMKRWDYGGDPLVSCFVNDCLAKGADIDRGGARYNWIMPSFVGLANLADSFMTIKKIVFDDKRMTVRDLYGILSENYENNEDLRLEVLNRIPKYGNDMDEADLLVKEITGWIREETGKHITYRGSRFVPGLFCYVMHERFGSETQATPDGRSKGFPLGDGSGPAQGREMKGPTATILSTTKWDHYPFIGGIAVNMKFGRSMFKNESLKKMIHLVRTFMERGGFELQINVVDNETLLKAREKPEAYRDLVVRVGGYSDYFVNLSPAMQEEVILRTEHEI